MKSLSFRGRVAAILVAIFCIISIIPFSASAASCSHPDDKLETVITTTNNGKHNILYLCHACNLTWEVTSVACTYIVQDGKNVCMSCGYISPLCVSHSYQQSWVSARGDGTHIECVTCNVCGDEKISDPIQCIRDSSGKCVDCGTYLADDDDCLHGSAEPTIISFNDGTHRTDWHCSDCGYEAQGDRVSCSYQNGVCTVCDYSYSGDSGGGSGGGVVVVCPHDFTSTVFAYKEKNYHRKLVICNKCKLVVQDTTLRHNFVDNICEECHINKIPEDVPDDALSAFVYLDSDARWTVVSDSYFGGVNLLNLTLLNPYIHDSSTLQVRNITPNAITIYDKYGAVKTGNKQTIDLNIVDHTWFEDGVNYVFNSDIESPYGNVNIQLRESHSDGSITYIKRGSSFVYSSDNSYRIIINTNTSTSEKHGEAFEVTFKNLLIAPASTVNYEPFGVRYFNNALGYKDYQTVVKYLGNDFATYAAALDYYGGIAYESGSYRYYRDNILYHRAEQLFPGITTLYNSKSDTVRDHTSIYYQLFEKLVPVNGGNYNLGYTDGYAAAVDDFEGVTEGGMVEGMINGGFSSVAKTWNILSNGISISGVSVGGIASTAIILLIAYFLLMVIAR